MFEVVLVEISRKFPKIVHFCEKITSTNGKKFWDTSTKVPRPPSPNIPGTYAFNDTIGVIKLQ